MKHIFFVLLLFSYLAAFSQGTQPGMKEYTFLQNERQRADKIVGDTPQPPLDSLKKAEQILLDALTYYQQPDVQELAKTNKYLFGRKGDISFDLALIQAKMNQPDKAAQTLTYPLSGKSASDYATWINNEPALASVRQQPAIAGLLAKASVGDKLFNSSALKTPYQVNISEDEKVAGLSKLWSEAKYNFAYFDHLPELDWDKLYLDYLPRIRNTRSTAEYYRVLKNFCAQLHDGHTSVWASDSNLADSVSRRPPIGAVLLDGNVLIEEVLSDSLQRTGIRPGLAIVTIDGIPAIDYADRYVRPYQSGSTVQNVDVQTYQYNLLRGPKDKPVTITFRDARGQSFTRILPRTGYGKLTPAPSFHLQILPGNIAYVQLNDFENNKALNGFRAAFDSIAATNSLILDVRRNGGGDSSYGWNILGYLTNIPMPTGSYESRIYSPLRRARGEGIVLEPVESANNWPPNGKKLYTKPVVVLTSGQTFSAAEDFAVVFDVMKRGIIIGEPTGGSTGQPLAFSLPGGVMARVCTKRDMYPDGTEWNAKGIQPNILVKPTLSDYQSGRDTVLEAALVHLGTGSTKSKVRKVK